MKKVFIFIVIIVGILVAGFSYRYFAVFQPDEKVYVALEGDGVVAVIDAARHTPYRTIDLSISHEGGILKFAPHNVQVAPNGRNVWVTANAGAHEAHTGRVVPSAFAHGDEDGGAEADEVVVIDPLRDTIIQRVLVAQGVHLAHVVITPDGAYAYVTAQKEGVIYKINTLTFTVEKEIRAPEGSEPHGIRISPDGLFAYIAFLQGRTLGILDIQTDALSFVPLGGAAVQTGVTQNGDMVFTSLYDTKKIAVYYPKTRSFASIDLPQGAKGPIQMYATPDSRFLYVADQGYYFGEPISDILYKIDLGDLKIVREISLGRAPHGVVVSKDGKFIYVTNLLSGDVSVVSSVTDEEITRIKVGKEPNGVSVWSRSLGGTP